MKVTSPAFQQDRPINPKYTADGQNISPPLHVEELPAGTKELAVIVEDPDAPTAEPFVHWVMYKIPPTSTDLPEGVKTARRVDTPPGAMQGPNDMKKIGYTGPEPPAGHGTHHYHFRVYALDRKLEVQPGADEKSLLASMSGHIIDSAETIGTYERMR